MITHAFALVRRFWPQLACLYLLERIVEPWMLRLCVEVAFFNRLLGLSALALLVLFKLVVLLWMFYVVRPGLSSLASPPSATGAAASDTQRFTTVLSVVLVPFFAYYAAWGFLGDTVRAYSLLGLRFDPFGEHGPLLRAGDSQWLLLIVAASWLLRKVCDEQMRRHGAFSWRLAATLLGANWVFIGLYALGAYKEQIGAWLAQLPVIAALVQISSAVKTSLSDIALPGFAASWSTLFNAVQDVFFYMLLPLVWFALTALIYNRKMDSGERQTPSTVERIEGRYATLPGPMRKITDRLIGGYRTRYLPVARSVELTLTSGVSFLLLFILSYRVLTWGSAWLWIGAKHLIGPYSQDVWFVIADVLTLLVGNPLGPERGVLIEPLRICLLAAAFDTALTTHRLTSPGAGTAGTAAARPG
jgi:hypothetical protein